MKYYISSYYGSRIYYYLMTLSILIQSNQRSATHCGVAHKFEWNNTKRLNVICLKYFFII